MVMKMFAYENSEKNGEIKEIEHCSWEDVYIANRVSLACEEEDREEDELIDSVIDEYLQLNASKLHFNKASAKEALAIVE